MATYIARNFPKDVSVSVADNGGTNTVTLRVKNVDGTLVRSFHVFDAYLASDTSGTPATSAPDGGTTAGTGSVIVRDSGLSYRIITDDDGDAILTLTDSGTPTFYLVIIKQDGEGVVSDAITFAG